MHFAVIAIDDIKSDTLLDRLSGLSLAVITTKVGTTPVSYRRIQPVEIIFKPFDSLVLFTKLFAVVSQHNEELIGDVQEVWKLFAEIYQYNTDIMRILGSKFKKEKARKNIKEWLETSIKHLREVIESMPSKEPQDHLLHFLTEVIRDMKPKEQNILFHAVAFSGIFNLHDGTLSVLFLSMLQISQNEIENTLENLKEINFVSRYRIIKASGLVIIKIHDLQRESAWNYCTREVNKDDAILSRKYQDLRNFAESIEKMQLKRIINTFVFINVNQWWRISFQAISGSNWYVLCLPTLHMPIVCYYQLKLKLWDSTMYNLCGVMPVTTCLGIFGSHITRILAIFLILMFAVKSNAGNLLMKGTCSNQCEIVNATKDFANMGCASNDSFFHLHWLLILSILGFSVLPYLMHYFEDRFASKNRYVRVSTICSVFVIATLLFIAIYSFQNKLLLKFCFEKQDKCLKNVNQIRHEVKVSDPSEIYSSCCTSTNGELYFQLGNESMILLSLSKYNLYSFRAFVLFANALGVMFYFSLINWNFFAGAFRKCRAFFFGVFCIVFVQLSLLLIIFSIGYDCRQQFLLEL